jgi:hypothetical protein
MPQNENRFTLIRVTIVADAPRWDLERGDRFADACADAGVAWIEEPLAMDEYDELAALTEASEVPIAGGELHGAGLPELRMMIERRFIDRLGGIRLDYDLKGMLSSLVVWSRRGDPGRLRMTEYSPI